MKLTSGTLLLFFATHCMAEVDLNMVNRIRAEGLHQSEVMHTLQHLTDLIGPRLSGSPQMKQANEWTRDKLQEWGLEETHLEAFEFGRGWTYDSASVDLLTPRKTSLHGIPVAWTPATNGAVEGEVVYVDAVTEEELEQYRSKLRGKVVLLTPLRDFSEPRNEVFQRLTAKELKELGEFNVMRGPSHRRAPSASQDRGIQARKFRWVLSKFLANEGAMAALQPSYRDGGLINVFGFDHQPERTFSVPVLVLEAEHHSLLHRLLDLGETPTVSIDIQAQFHDDDSNAYNTLGEIPGTKKKPEIVMTGAHLDSWHASTGAVDNAAGVAITMEAMRILSVLDVKPKRTIRIALWSGEEQGLFGSYQYVRSHFATRPLPENPDERSLPRWMWRSPGWPITTLPDYDRFSAYFNLDNGSGRIRGIYTEGNAAVKPIFSSWFGPFSDLSAGTVVLRATGGTDHESFDDVGLPGFQFIQDGLDYSSRLHHTHIDSYDHAVEADMKQASTILAAFLYNAATMEKRMPREVMPARPTAISDLDSAREARKARRAREREAKRSLDMLPE